MYLPFFVRLCLNKAVPFFLFCSTVSVFNHAAMRLIRRNIIDLCQRYEPFSAIGSFLRRFLCSLHNFSGRKRHEAWKPMIPTSPHSLWYNILADSEAGSTPSSHRQRDEGRMKRKQREEEIRRSMLEYFATYDGNDGAPSFSKFRRKGALSLVEFNRMKNKRSFREAMDECSEFRRDYLIDCGLTKRFDASFVKFLLQSEDECENPDDGAPIISFEVVDDEKV